MVEMDSDKDAPIAIIGINLKFPGEAISPQAFWELMHSKKNVVKEVPPSRFNIDGETGQPWALIRC